MARKSLLSWSLLGLLLVSALSVPAWADDDDSGVADVEDDEYADAERAQLVVRKSVKDDLVVQGMNVTITVDIYNSGAATAYKVKLVDMLPHDATLVEGSLTADLGKISIGSHVVHTYTVVFNSGALQISMPTANVTYVAEADSTDSTAGQSSVQVLYVMTPVQQIQRYALKVGAYASLGFARSASEWRNLAIVLGTIGSLLGANWAVKRVGATRVNRRREKALKELSKSD